MKVNEAIKILDSINPSLDIYFKNIEGFGFSIRRITTIETDQGDEERGNEIVLVSSNVE